MILTPIPSILLAAFALMLSASPPFVAGQDASLYLLTTKVLAGDHTKNGLIVATYHVGAGLNDAVLTPDGADGAQAYLNGTDQQFDLGDEFAWGLVLEPGSAYSRWLDVQVNVGYGDAGFSFNESGLVSSNPEWGGWLVCDWSHLVPQLFWQQNEEDLALPSTCAAVELHPEPVGA